MHSPTTSDHDVEICALPAGLHNGTVTAEPSPALANVELVADVIITEELSRRPLRPADLWREKEALHDLAARMLDQPDEVLPRFVELAMTIAGGSSAGLSLLEPDPAPGIFRWHHVCGDFTPFEGTTTPRDDSPCGVTLDHAGPVLTRHAERLYRWIAEAGIVVPEVLLVPLRLDDGGPLGTLWIVGESAGHFDGGHARAAMELAGFVGIALRMRRDREQLSRALERQARLAREMSHRVTNLFAVTDSMIRFGARAADSKEELVAVLSGRLQALAAAHRLAWLNPDDAAMPHAPDLVALATAVVVAPQGGEIPGLPARITLQGPAVALGRQAASGLALVLHELATNATKYGALSAEAGRVDLGWRIAGEVLVLRWEESAGPPVAAVPSREGFGSRLLHGTVVRQLGGKLERTWTSEGLIVDISIPVAHLTT